MTKKTMIDIEGTLKTDFVISYEIELTGKESDDEIREKADLILNDENVFLNEVLIPTRDGKFLLARINFSKVLLENAVIVDEDENERVIEMYGNTSNDRE